VGAPVLIDPGFALFLTVALPIGGALFCLAMPGVDRLALRHVGVAVGIAAGLCALVAVRAGRASFSAFDVTLRIDTLSAPLLLTLAVFGPVALRAGAPRVFERTQFYVVTALFLQGMLAAALLVDAPLLLLGILPLSAVPLFALVALFGGPLRGSTTLKTAVVWILVDIVALAALALVAADAGVDVTTAALPDLARAAAARPVEEQRWLFLALAAPAFVRLAAGPFSVWLAAFLDEAPVSAAVLACCGAAPVGVHVLARVALPIAPHGAADLIPVFFFFGVLAFLVSGLIAVAERDLRRLCAQLLQIGGASAALALCTFDAAAVAIGTVHVVATGASAALFLIAVEAAERRFETRDVVELSGLARSVPLVGGLTLLGLCALVGVPATGAGTTLWMCATAFARAPTLPPFSGPLLAAALAGGALLAAAGAAAVARRALAPPHRKHRRFLEEVTGPQAARLWVPALLAVIIGLAAPFFVERAVPAARALGIPEAVP
jgi:NADH:ubiquinone oxidoreductase subunit 4 (subunit M)